MGKQSARLYFKGMEHKEIYFQGHYHDAVYIGSTLVWEKIKSRDIENISMMSYLNGKYYIIAESTDDLNMESRTVLYEGESLDAMEKKGYVFGDMAASGEYYIMYADNTELTVIRYDIHVEDRFMARIPVINGEADLGNVSYEIVKYKYGNDEYKYYVFGNGNNYYYISGTGIGKTGNEIPFDTDILKGGSLLIANEELILVPNGVSDSTSQDAYLNFGILDDENEKIQSRKVSLSPLIEFMNSEIKESIANIPNTTGYFRWNSLSFARPSFPGNYGGVVMTSKDAGYIDIEFAGNYSYFTRNGFFDKETKRSVHYFYKGKIDFTDFTIIICKRSSEYCEVLSQFVGMKYRACIYQLRPGATYLSCGIVGDDINNDISLYDSDIEDMSIGSFNKYWHIACMAECEDTVLIGVYDRDPNTTKKWTRFIEVDMKNGTARKIEIHAQTE